MSLGITEEQWRDAMSEYGATSRDCTKKVLTEEQLNLIKISRDMKISWLNIAKAFKKMGIDVSHTTLRLHFEEASK